MAAIRSTVVFTGQVQGVGFRATTRQVARGFDVTGWVRNEPDGSVRCVVEGEADEVNRFIDAVKQRMGALIRDTAIETGTATDEFDDFSIAY